MRKLDLQKKQHRERAQPLNRQKLGLLEKHGDYVKRARDFHSKEDRIKTLREKASGRNKDEFYFGMIKSRTLKGVHVQSRGNEALPMDLVKVLKTQDAGYIRTQRAIEESRVQKLQQELDILVEDPSPLGAGEGEATGMFDNDNFIGATASSSAPLRKHVLFTSNLDIVQNGDAASLLKKRPRSSLGSSSEPARPTKRTRKGKASTAESELLTATRAAEDAERTKVAAAHRASVTTELEARKERLSSLSRALRELEMQRVLMGKGAKKAMVSRKNPKDPRDVEDDWELGGRKGKGLPDAQEGIATGARVWKWKAERKR